MDVEKTIEFILETQAKFEAGLEQFREETNRRIAEGERQAARHERQMRGLQKLTKMGMRMLVKHDEKLEKLTEDLNALIRMVDEIIRRGQPPLA
jgi:hypothetical protein